MTTVTDDERGGPRPGRAGHADPSLNAAGGVKKTARPGGLRRAIAFLNQQRKIALTTYAAVAVATACQLAIPLLVQQIIDVVRAADAARGSGGAKLVGDAGQATKQLVHAGGPAVDLTPLYWAVGGIVAVGAVRALFAFGQGFLAEVASQNVALTMRNDLFGKIQRLSFSYHDRNQTGQLMVRATDDVEKVRMFLGQGFVIALQALLMLVGILAILFSINARVTWVVVPILPVAIGLFVVFGRIVQPLFGQVQMRLGLMNSVLQENLAGIRVVRAFAREDREKARFEASAEALMVQQLKASRVLSFLFPAVFLTANLGQALVVWFGGLEVQAGGMSIGAWNTFQLYLIYAFLPIGQLGFIVALLAQANTSAGRIFEILDTQNEIIDSPNAQPLAAALGRVAFEDVTFRYFRSGDAILRGVSFEAAPGQTVALLGATGSGKSTIINLIPRFYDATDGAVTIDGRDVRDITLESLRRQVGIVLQETTLFSGTIRDNIAFGRPEATLEDVRAAARAAQAAAFIEALPEGYDTPVGERGTTLSGGQKQRIAIARAILMDPRILILDDATSAVDLTTELAIQRALDALMEGRTSFVIAQRVSTVRRADVILVLDKGTIAARGTHAELLESSPTYVEIVASQLVDDAQHAAVAS